MADEPIVNENRTALSAWLDSREFYELMQAYRHAFSPADTVAAYEAVKTAIREHDTAHDLLAVAKALDGFQRDYDRATYQTDRMPGNDLYSGMAMRIVKAARAAIAKGIRS